MQLHVDAIKTQMTGVAFLEPEPFDQWSPKRCHVWRTGLVGGGKRLKLEPKMYALIELDLGLPPAYIISLSVDAVHASAKQPWSKSSS